MIKLYDISTICGEVTRIWVFLWMVYTFILKRLREVEKMGRIWMYIALFTVVYFAAIAVDHSSLKFKGIYLLVNHPLMDWTPKLVQNFRNYRRNPQFQEQRRGNYYWKLRKKKVKNKKVFKNYLSRWTSGLSSINAGRARASQVEKIYFLSNWSTTS